VHSPSPNAEIFNSILKFSIHQLLVMYMYALVVVYLGNITHFIRGLLLFLYAVSSDFFNAVAWILRVFPSTGGVYIFSTSCWVHNFWWIINYCSVSSWFQQMHIQSSGLNTYRYLRNPQFSHNSPSGANAHQLLYNWQSICPLPILTF
jgi:hypothetical protein